MSRIINLRGSKDNKFTVTRGAKTKVVRKNVLIAPELHAVICEVIIETGETLKVFVQRALDDYIGEDFCSKQCKEAPDYNTWVNSTIYLPQDLIKEIKRESRRNGVSQNEIIIRCIKAKVSKLKESNPEIITI